MNQNDTRILLEYIIKSQKIKRAFEAHKGQFKLDKKRIIETILADLNDLWLRFKDVSKIKLFVEAFVCNHITDFLIPQRQKKDYATNVEDDITEANDVTAAANDDVTAADVRISQDPMARMQREMEERRKQAAAAAAAPPPKPKEQQLATTTIEVNTEEKNAPSNVEIAAMLQPPPPSQQQPVPMVFQPPAAQPPPQPQQAQTQQLQAQLIQIQQMQQNIQRQLMLQQQQQQQRPQQTPPPPPPLPLPLQQRPQQPQQQQQQPLPAQGDRSVIHIDARERNLEEYPRSNPFSIYMNDNTTCLISVKDMMVSNFTNDGYLLIQISEYNKSVYENQLNRDIQFKLLRTHKDTNFSYYRNVDLERMIKVQDVSRITFNIVRPNGKLLFAQKDNVFNNCTVQMDTSGGGGGNNTAQISIGGGSHHDLTEADTLTLFDKDLEKGVECRVVAGADSAKPQVVQVEWLEGNAAAAATAAAASYKRVMSDKYQISLSLEII
jgi:hypothetical protein